MRRFVGIFFAMCAGSFAVYAREAAQLDAYGAAAGWVVFAAVLALAAGMALDPGRDVGKIRVDVDRVR